MEEKPRNSGIDAAGAIPWGTHFCLFYETKNELIELLHSYFRAGLENNELCVWAIPEPFEVERAREDLINAILDFGIYFEKNQIEIVPYTACCVKDTFFDPQKALNYWKEKLSKALKKGYTGLRLIEDRFWMEKSALKDFITYEKKINFFTHKHQMLVLCPYRLEVSSPEVIINAVSNHQISLIKKNGKWEKIENFGWKTAEKELYESEEKYKAFFESSIDAVLLTSPDGIIYAANPEACQVFGLSEEELIQAGRNGVIDIDDPRLRPALEERARTGKFKGELNFRRKNGTIFPGEVSSALFTEKNGLVKTAMVIRDVTERKGAEEALCESEKKYRTLFETMQEGFFIADIITNEAGEPVDFRTLEANRAFETQTGLLPNKFVNSTALKLYPDLDPFWIQTYGHVALTGTPVHFEYYLDVQKRYYEVSAYQIRPGRFAAIFLDITDRKKAEEKIIKSENEFRTLAENSPDIILRLDKKNRHVYANPAALKAYRLSYEEVIGKSHYELGRNLEQIKLWEKYHKKVFSTGKPETIEI